MRKQFSIILFIFTLPLLSVAQSFDLGGIYGVSGYLGDLNEKLFFRLQRDRTMTGGFLRYHINKKINVRLNVYSGSISGSDFDYTKKPWRQQRGFSFVSPIKEYSVLVGYDVLKLFPKAHKVPLTLRANVGIGMANINPKVDYNEPNSMYEDVSIDKFAQYNHNLLVLPLGIDFSWQFSKTFSIGFDGSMHKTFTDYVDGVSKLGQPKLKDWYFFGGISVIQKLNSISSDNKTYHYSKRHVRCPTF
jgi:Domain of unknown function (DUF6089)